MKPVYKAVLACFLGLFYAVISGYTLASRYVVDLLSPAFVPCGEGFTRSNHLSFWGFLGFLGTIVSSYVILRCIFESVTYDRVSYFYPLTEEEFVKLRRYGSCFMYVLVCASMYFFSQRM